MFLLVGTCQQLAKVGVESIKVGDTDITPSSYVKNLGVHLDNHMSMDVHISKVCSKAYHGLYNVCQISKFLNVECMKTLFNAFVMSRVDYCNSLLIGLPD